MHNRKNTFINIKLLAPGVSQAPEKCSVFSSHTRRQLRPRADVSRLVNVGVSRGHEVDPPIAAREQDRTVFGPHDLGPPWVFSTNVFQPSFFARLCDELKLVEHTLPPQSQPDFLITDDQVGEACRRPPRALIAFRGHAPGFHSPFRGCYCVDGKDNSQYQFPHISPSFSFIMLLIFYLSTKY